jgi:hypothetical protein
VAGELDAFAKIAIYLKDPLVLSGFVVFLGFLGLRQLLKSGVIPVLQQGQGFRILRLLLSYGFVLGLAIVLLGMGLKYRELSEGEQRRAAALVASELEANVTVVSELGKNTESLSKLARGLAGILRDQRFKILAGLFPPQNIDVSVEESTLTNLYMERMEWLDQSQLWEDPAERRRTEEACAAINRFIERTRSTVESLSDQQAIRYQITHRAYDANLDVVRKISLVDMTQLANLYYRMNDVRVLYNRIVTGSLEYMLAVGAFCASLPPTSASLSPTLALERLTVRLLPEYQKKTNEVVKAILEQVLTLGPPKQA